VAALDDRTLEVLLRRAFEASGEAMALVDLEPSGRGRLLRVNAAMSTLTGHAPEALVALSVVDLAGPDDVDGWLGLLDRLSTAGGDADRSERRCRTAEGASLSVEVTCSPVPDDLGSTTRAVIRLHQVRGRGPAVDSLPEAARHDALTGVLNREGLERRLQARVDQRSAQGGAGALLFCDVDDLKDVNDRYGHLAGDAVIRATAARLVDCVRTGDLVARFGGDEFVVVAWGLAGPAVDSLVRRISDRVAEEVHHDGRVLRVTVSIGVAMLDPATTSVEETLRRADASMYATKRYRHDSSTNDA